MSLPDPKRAPAMPPVKPARVEFTDRDTNLLNSCAGWLLTRSEMRSFAEHGSLMREYAAKLHSIRSRLEPVVVEKPVAIDELFGGEAAPTWVEYPVQIEGIAGFCALRVPSRTPEDVVKALLKKLPGPKATFHR